MRVVILLLAILALSAFIGCQAKPMVVPESGSGSEGIKVHGDWTIEVTNPDGSLATRKQFTNSFDGKHIVAALLSLDLEVERRMAFGIKASPATLASPWSEEDGCKETSNFTASSTVQHQVPVKVVHASNADDKMNNSVWNGSCTLEINGDESRFITQVWTNLQATPQIKEYAPKPNVIYAISNTLSTRVLDEPIEVWDGQVVAATVILSVD